MAENLRIPKIPTPASQQGAWGKLVSSSSTTYQSFVIDKPSVKIGRAPCCDVIIEKGTVHSNALSNISKEHCVLTKDPFDNNIYITDLSKNGTYVNGERIQGPKVILRDKDKIALGHKYLTVYVFESLMGDLPDTITPRASYSPNIVASVPPPTWGRLVSCVLHLTSFDLFSSTFKVGRSPVCDAVINKMNIDSVFKSKFSKEHFVIVRDNENSITYITDLSKLGTYLNGCLIGKNNKHILQNDDTIAIGPKKTRVYVYKSMSSSDANCLPAELRRKYEPNRLLGKGACGEVRLAYEKRTCNMYAIKKILKGRSTASQLHKLNHPSKIQMEINILKSLTHPFVINMKEIVETQEEVFIVLEFMKGGELTNRILSNVPLTESNAKFLFYQIVLAVKFLHDRGITHRDLKPENILLFSDDQETLVKVSDFGLSKVTEDDDLMQTMCGTLYYVAPEVINARIPEYDRQVDVWSLGVILFYMLSKRLPFKAPDRATTNELIISGVYSMDDAWNGISYLAKDLVKRMLTVDPHQRITVNDILQHHWLEKDTPMQYRVQTMLEETLGPFEMLSSDVEPPAKRIRLSLSDESSTD